MKFTGPLIVVEDIAVSRKFYEEVLGQKVIMDFGANITFEGGVSLQTKVTWLDFIDKQEKDILSKGNNFELYFEEDNFDEFMKRFDSLTGIERVHDVKEYPWGQRVIRFYDPDKHIVEVGENMEKVMKRFLKQGMSVEEVSKRTMMPIEYVQSCQE